MAKSKTPEKRAKQAEANRLRNKSYKSRMRTSINDYEAALAADNIDAARENLLQATSIIDKTVSKGVLHKKTAARKKSQLVKKFNERSKTISQ